jgi:hypothetical protein
MATEYNHGAVYLPSSTSNTGIIRVDQLEGLNICQSVWPAASRFVLRHYLPTVAYIHVQWVELTNTVRYRILSVPYFRTLLESTRPGIGIPKITMGRAWGEYLYVPDLSTMRLCPHAPGEAVVMGWFKEKTPYLGARNQLTFDVPLCPRATLQRVVQ